MENMGGSTLGQQSLCLRLEVVGRLICHPFQMKLLGLLAAGICWLTSVACSGFAGDRTSGLLATGICWLTSVARFSAK